MFDVAGKPPVALSPLEAGILKLIKPKSQAEKKIAKKLAIDPLILSPIITDLILKGYLEIFRRRYLYFFSREFCSITPEGLSALDRQKSLFENLFEMVRGKAVEAIDGIAAQSPVLKVAIFSARALYKAARVVG